MAFMGGSSYAMATSLMEGYIIPSPTNMKRLTVEEMRELLFEIDKLLRELRGEIIDPNDFLAIKKRNQKIMKLQSAQNVISNHLQLKIKGRI
ncbi:MAG: hypothetical protein N2445_02360 [Acidobacteria bacterium]|nr:hypothetical protein [Acidobacteriota bacterium]